MKTTLNLLLLGIMAALCCSVANAQLIYSNNFALGGAVTISNTPPTVANSYGGGTNNALWNDVLGINDPGALLANGTELATTTLGDSFILPFTPLTGHVYLLTGNLTFTGSPGNWVGLGFALYDSNNVANGYARFSDSGASLPNGYSPRGYDWMIITESSGNVQYFGGAGGSGTVYSSNGAFPPGPGTETAQIMLDTESTPWSIAAYVNGVQMGTNNYTYASNPTIRGVGMTQNALTAPTMVKWNYMSLATTLQPFVVQEPRSQNVSAGGIFTNSVQVTADPSGGTLAYQWYAGGVPLVNGGTVSGANTNVLKISSVSASNAATNYYVIVTSSYGSATSSLASLTVYVTTTITATTPLSYTNPITLFGGTNIEGTNYLGSSPTFSVTAAGNPPLIYRWLTNGVLVAGATNSSFTFTNCQLGGATNFICLVSNSFGLATNVWSAVYVPTPVAPYPQAVLAGAPLAFWRLNEPDDGLGDYNPGAICNDYQSANNGIYTNVSLSQTGYNPNEPTETSAAFGRGGLASCHVGQIQGVDFAQTNGANAEFTVEAWANCSSGGGTAGGAPVVTKGVYLVSDAFSLGVDTNSSTQNYRFYVRTANGTVYTADSAIPAVDFTWHHLVGVCDEANTNVSLYVDGRLAASAYIPAKSGNYEANSPVAIGAGIKSGSTTYNLQFTGNIDDVAGYGYALSSATVAAQYIAEQGGSAPFFTEAPPATVTIDSGRPLVIPAIVSGSAPLGYYWTDENAGTNVAAGVSSSESLDATLTVPDAPVSWNGDQLELTVTNAAGSISYSVTLDIVSGRPQIVSDVATTFGAPLGGTASNSIVVTGSAPLAYQWQFNGVNLTDNGQITGSQSNVLSIANAQLADEGGYQVVVTNDFGAVTSSIASFVVVNAQPLSFNGNGAGWTLNNVVNISGTTVVTNGGLTLTDGSDNEARTFFFSYPVYVGAFRAAFTYQDVNGGGADGWAFVVQNDPRGPAAEGGDGGRVGIESGGGDTGTSIMPSWELEFNIYHPVGVGYDMETDGAVGPPWLPTGNQGDANYAAETNMVSSGDPISITLTYANDMMDMVMTDAVAGVSFSTNTYIGDLTQLAGGSTAYVGFTAGDGGVSSVQTITNFTFTSLAPLAIQLSGTNAVVSWPNAIVGYTLQENADLTTTNWVNVTNSPVTTTDEYQVVVPAGGTQWFYRLNLQ